MPGITTFLNDVRALGLSAPIRALYEASKRTNGHAILFRRVLSDHRSRPLPFGDQVPTDEDARARCLDDAQRIVHEGVRVFGRRVATGANAAWAMDPLTEQCWPEETFWWQIDIRSDKRLSDVKFVWEAARHRDLVVLARAAVLDPDGEWLKHLEGMLIRWCHECQPERGVNWYSSLELALRAISWSQVLRLVGDRLHGGLRAELDLQLVASARHIMVELPYTLSSMKNNHLLGDGLGLVVLGKMFPEHPAAKRWRKIGDWLILKQLSRHMLPDGSMIEDSLSYHRFVLEMFIVRVLLGDAPTQVTAAMRHAAHHLATMGALDGQVPQYGDWDEGRVLADSNNAGDVAGAAYLAMHLSGLDTPAEAWSSYDELAWYADPALLTKGSERKSSSTWASGHFSGAKHGPWRVWLKHRLTPSHQHADLSALWIQYDEAWVVEDPGTGTYNGPLHVRNGFRTSAAHSLWRPSGQDLLGPHRAFRWKRSTVRCGYGSLDLDGASLLATWHEGFGDQKSLRLVLIDDDGVTVLDRLPDLGPSWHMTLPQGPAFERIWGVHGETMIAQENPFAGWKSRTYGEWLPSPWLHVDGEEGWHMWGAGRSRNFHVVDTEHLEIEEDSLSVVEHADSVTIRYVTTGQVHTLEALVA